MSKAFNDVWYFAFEETVRKLISPAIEDLLSIEFVQNDEGQLLYKMPTQNYPNLGITVEQMNFDEGDLNSCLVRIHEDLNKDAREYGFEPGVDLAAMLEDVIASRRVALDLDCGDEEWDSFKLGD